MKKVININFQGRVVPIEETAHDILKQYVESLKKYFSKEEGSDEIINDIEGRIAELFGETLKKGGTCITDDDVNAIISSMGRPEDFDAEDSVGAASSADESKQQSQSGASSSFSQSTYATTGKKLYRDENNKFLGGVCAGLGNYFGIDTSIVRILFVIFSFGFGFGFITYLILWVAVPSSASTTIGSVRKRLFRDPDNKLIAGVCSGLSNYFGVNVWIPRILFIIPFLTFFTNWVHWGSITLPNFISLSFSPGSTLLYIILWLVLPEATTTTEKLEMRGEKVDLNSIKTTIQQDMEGFKERAEKFGKEAGERAKEFGATIAEKGKQFGKEAGSSAGSVARRTGSTIGDIIAFIFKVFAYFILAVVIFAVVIALFSVGIALTGLLPLKGYLIGGGWENIFAWGALILFIWVPVIGIITWIIRRIAKIKSTNNTIRFAFVALWILGLFCAIGLISSLVNDFSNHNSPVETNVPLTNSRVDKLEVKFRQDNRYYWNSSWLHMEPFLSIDQDTAFVRNIHLRILKSDSDSFHVTSLKMSNGASREEAERRVNNFSFDVNQKDSFLLLDKGIPVTTTDKFRNQSVYISIYVPVGKRILVQDNVGWGNDFHMNFGGDVDDWYWRYDDRGYGWDHNVEYIMTSEGLKRVHPEVKNNDDDDNEDQQNNRQDTLPRTDSGYKYKPAQPDTPKKVKLETQAKEVIINKTSETIGSMASMVIEKFSL